MKKVLSLLTSRTRLPRPVPAMSVPAELAKQYRVMARRSFLFGVAGFGYGLYERSNHVAAMARPPQTFGAILSPQGAILKTVSADSLTENEFEMVARATAAQFVQRMRNATNPIDFTLAALDEGNYFIKDAAVGKVRDWLTTRPFDELTKRRQRRVVLLEQVIATVRPGRGKEGDQVLVAVQWPEKIEAVGSSPTTEIHGGEVLVERVRNVSPDIALHNPIGMFVSNYSFDVPS
jgi:type IV secretory pathway TrbF-like protein